MSKPVHDFIEHPVVCVLLRLYPAARLDENNFREEYLFIYSNLLIDFL